MKEDIKYVSFKNKLLCGISLAGSMLTKIIPPLKNYSDSIYVEAFRDGERIKSNCLDEFYAAHQHNPLDNLNVVHLLQCPISGQALQVSSDRNFVVTTNGLIKYPVKENIPILVRSEIISN